MPAPHSLRQRIALGVSLTMMVVLLTTGLAMLMICRAVLVRSNTRHAVTTVQMVHELARESEADTAGLHAVLERVVTASTECDGLAVLRRGTVLAAFGAGAETLPELSLRSSEAQLRVVEHERWQVVLFTGVAREFTVVGWFTFQLVDQTLLASGLVVAVSLMAGLVLSIVLAGHLGAALTGDLQRLRQAVRRISQGHLSQRVQVSASSDLHGLSEAINAMARQLERTLEDLQSAYGELARLDEIKADVLATVSHELRTPLTALRGYLGLLVGGKMGPMSDQVSSAVDVCQANVERLTRRVDEMVQIADLEHRWTETEEMVDIQEMLSSVLDVFVPRMDEKHLVSRLDVVSEPLLVRGRRDTLERVFLNLLDNAVKFTPRHGSITVEVRGQQREEHEGVLVVVTDTGPGIPPAEQVRVFDRFYQVDPSARRRFGGMGLGLALVRSTVESHDGFVWLESHLGVGSAFFVWLPAQPADAAASSQTADPPTNQQVEDHH